MFAMAMVWAPPTGDEDIRLCNIGLRNKGVRHKVYAASGAWRA